MSFFDKLKDVNEMRKQAKQIELLLAEEKVTGSSSGGKVQITIDGNMKVLSVSVDESVAGDKSEVARQVRAALEDMFAKHKKALQSRLGHMMQ